jgi:hypothetical protein
MRWINARTGPAKMIDFFSIWYLSPKESVDGTMHVLPFTARSGIAILVDVPHPEPASSVRFDIDFALQTHR